MDVVIVGGGLIGLSVGWRLARAGRSVLVLERDAEGARPSAAGWAAAGMLAPLAEAGFQEEAQLALGRASLELYPAWAAELEAESGIGIDYRTEGTMIVALDRDDTAWLERIFRMHRESGLPTEWISGSEAREREPHLARAVSGAVLSGGDHQVDNRRMLEALRVAFLRAGGEIRRGARVTGIEETAGRVTGVRVGGGEGVEERIPAERVLACAGAWTREAMGGLPASAVPPVRPVKGQLLALEMSPLLRLERVIRTRRVYLVPKGDGRLVIGATSEERGFDDRLTAGGMLDLLRDAWEVVPGIYDLPVLESWSGFRPAARDNAPVLGPTPVEGLFVATGHYRNGVLLAPITARAIADLVLGGEPDERIRPFALDRFHRTT